jgi:AcrR family transcriptional regulator
MPVVKLTLRQEFANRKIKDTAGLDATAAALPLTRREAGKAERRRLIISAARDLIRETGNAGLSMRGLAARAGVSLATPYNLFGSKRAIVVAVLQDVRAFYERFSQVEGLDPVERIFAALDISVAFYLDDPQFYKTLWSALFDASDAVRGDILNPKRDAFWRGLIDAAAQAGVIDEAIDLDLLQHQLELALRAVMFDWVIGHTPPDRLGPTARFGYALILLGAAAPDHRASLKARLLESQKVLSAV